MEHRHARHAPADEMRQGRGVEMEHIGSEIADDAVEQPCCLFERRRARGHPVELRIEPDELDAGMERLPFLGRMRPRSEPGNDWLDAMRPDRHAQVHGIAPHPADAVGRHQQLEPFAAQCRHGRSSSSASRAGR
jgi:hypothetical protein